MRLETIKNKLENLGIETKYNYVLNQEAKKRVLVCDTNYNGPYPTKETFDTINAILRIAKNNKTETRGYYTAVFIYE